MNGIEWESSKDEDNWDNNMEGEYETLLQRSGVTDDSYSLVKIIKGTGQTEVVERKPREIVLRVHTDSGMGIIVNQFFFPNWAARIDGEQQGLHIEPSQPDGLITLTLPSGDYQVRLL